MLRRNVALYLLLVLAAVTVPVLFGRTPLTQADLFDSPISRYDYLPIVQYNYFLSPMPIPSTSLYLPLVVGNW